MRANSSSTSTAGVVTVLLRRVHEVNDLVASTMRTPSKSVGRHERNLSSCDRSSAPSAAHGGPRVCIVEPSASLAASTSRSSSLGDGNGSASTRPRRRVGRDLGGRQRRTQFFLGFVEGALDDRVRVDQPLSVLPATVRVGPATPCVCARSSSTRAADEQRLVDHLASSCLRSLDLDAACLLCLETDALGARSVPPRARVRPRLAGLRPRRRPRNECGLPRPRLPLFRRAIRSLPHRVATVLACSSASRTVCVRAVGGLRLDAGRGLPGDGQDPCRLLAERRSQLIFVEVRRLPRAWPRPPRAARAVSASRSCASRSSSATLLEKLCGRGPRRNHGNWSETWFARSLRDRDSRHAVRRHGQKKTSPTNAYDRAAATWRTRWP